MKDWYRNKFLRCAIATFTLLGVTLISMQGTTPASASTGVTAELSIPQMPSSGSSMATWQTWASAQRTAMQSTDPMTASSPMPGCTINSGAIVPVTSTGADGVPVGIVTDAVTLLENCASAATASSSASGVIPLISQWCPVMNQANYSSATNGYVCVGTSTYNGNSNFMAAAYTYTGTGTFTAHSELATVSSPCPPGNAIANSSSYNLSQYQAAVVQWGPRNYSATWSGTGWHYNGGGYTDLGSVCGTW